MHVLEQVLEQKLFTMPSYATYWKDEIFQCHLRVNPGYDEKSTIKTRKVRIPVEICIQNFVI